MSVSRVIEVSFGNETVVYVNIDTAYYYNDGVIIKPTDGDLPDTYQVHWADSPEAQTTLATIGTSEGVPVPDELWGRSKVIYGWFYLHPTEDSSVTYKEIRIYKSARAGLPDGTEPTPSEHSTIDQLISAMNTAADKAEQNADSASSDADRAETARNEAETYATNAQTSASNAEASATTATNQAQIATTSATTATTAAQTATTKATEASDSASSAAESASSASDSADSASRSEQAAKISETNAADSESNASTYANSARGYAQTAQSASASASSSATSASNSANSASNSATSASQSASVATEAKADIEDMVESAKGYANASATNAASASRSADQAESAATNAATFATNAGNKAVEAAQSANTASSKATEASTSAQTASQKATEATQSASQALGYKNDAESAKTASQTAQRLAESARDSAISAKNDAESARDDAESARDEAQQAVASISGALADKAPVITDTASGAIASFSDGADDLPLKSLVVDINPVQDLHGQDAPYPAGGGKNKLDAAPFTVNSGTNYRHAFQTPVTLKAGTYTLSWAQSANITSNTRNTPYYFLDGNSKYDITTGNNHLGSGQQSWTFTIYNDVTVTFGYWANNIDLECTYSNFMIEVGSSATAFAPYENLCPISGWTEVNVNHSDADTTNPTTITINLGQTVYGGKLDVLSGELVIDRAMAGMGALNWAAYSAGINTYRTQIAPKAFGDSNLICSAYKTEVSAFANMTNGTIRGTTGNTYVYVRDDNYTDVTSFKSAVTGQTLVYELATPIEIQLTPNQLNSLYGVNNIWADSGDTEVEYRADTKLFIERLTAPDSADMIADANITSGQYFMVGNSLYKATANIANGSAIIVGTNCIRKSLSEALNEINA